MCILFTIMIILTCLSPFRSCFSSGKKTFDILDLLNNINNVGRKRGAVCILGNFNFRKMMLHGKGRKDLSGEHSLPHFISFL